MNSSLEGGMPVEDALLKNRENHPDQEGAVETAVDWMKEKNDSFLEGMVAFADKVPAILPVLKPLCTDMAYRGAAGRALWGKDIVTGEELKGVDRLTRSLQYTGKAMLNEAIAGLEVVGFIVPAAELPWAVRLAGVIAKGIKTGDASHIVKETPRMFRDMSEKANDPNAKEGAGLRAKFFETLDESPEATAHMVKGIEGSGFWKALTASAGFRSEEEIAQDLTSKWNTPQQTE